MPPPTSQVWKFFKRSADGNTVKCRLCSTELKYTGGTSNMRNHMKGRHPAESGDEKHSEKQQPPMTMFVDLPKKISATLKEKLTQAIADMVVLDYLPLSVVNGKGFQNLMKLAVPDYVIPSRNTVRARIEKRYSEERETLVNDLSKVESVSLTTDTWTSSATDSYITVTGHHIDTDWTLQNNVLMTRAMPERHTGENLAYKLQDCASDFGIAQKISTVVRDNARNMECAMARCGEWHDLGCFGHTLQLCIKPAIDIPAVTKIVTRSRKLVGHFKHSTTLTAEMRKRQKTLNVAEHELIQDVPTRWNSTHLMLQRLCEQRRVVTDIMLDNVVTKKSDTCLLLSNQEWELADELANVLEPLTAVTGFMSQEKDVSCSMIYPVVLGLTTKCLKVDSCDSPIVRKVKETVAGELERRYQPGDLTSARSTPAVASLLDPRYKKLGFFTPEQRAATEEALDSMLDEMPLRIRAQEAAEPSPKRAKKTHSLDFLEFASPDNSMSDDELKLFLSEKGCADDPLAWWRERETKFPRIAMIAKRLLSVPATSVPSERIFSSAGLVVNKLRTRLSCDLVDNIVFLNKNKFPLETDEVQ